MRSARAGWVPFAAQRRLQFAGTAGKGSKWGPAVVLSGMLLVALVEAFALAVGLWPVSLALVGLVFSGALYLFAMDRVGLRFDTFFWLPFIILFVASILLSATKVDLSLAQEVVVFAAMPFIVVELLSQWKRSNSLQVAIVLTALFLAISIVATFYGRSRLVAAAFTFANNLKPFILLGIGCVIAWSPKTERTFWLLVRWIWPILILSGLFQWLAFGAYQKIFGQIAADPHPFIHGVTRARTMFHHPAVSATIAATLGLAALIRYLDSRRLCYLLAAAGYFIVIVMSGERQELLCFMMAVGLTSYLWMRDISLGKMIVLSVVAGVVALAALYPFMPDMINDEVQAWGFGRYADPDNPRAILYGDAFRLANQYFPFGAGLGTFGSAGSTRFDQSLYLSLGYHAFWWFTKRNFLMDSYWARYIGEVGWLGFILMLSVYLVVLQRSLTWVRTTEHGCRERMYAMLGFAGLLFLLLASPTSFGLGESLQGFVPLVFLGLSWRMRRENPAVWVARVNPRPRRVVTGLAR